MACCPFSLRRSSALGLPVPAVLFLEPTPPRPFPCCPSSLQLLSRSSAAQLCASSSAGLGSSGGPPRKLSSSAPRRLGGGLVPGYSCALPTLSSTHARTHRCFHLLSALCSDFKSGQCLRADERSCPLLCYHLGSSDFLMSLSLSLFFLLPMASILS